MALVTVLALAFRAPATADDVRDDCIRGDAESCRQACKVRDVESCRRLGDAYASGVGVPKNETRAGLYTQACIEGIRAACTALDELCGRAPEACSCSRVQGNLPSAPPPPASKPPSPVRYQSARPIKMVKPRYPSEAFDKKIEGTVNLEIVIDAAGDVAETRVLKSIPGLDEAAVETVKQWRFSPTRVNGRAVATVAVAPVMFEIGRTQPAAPRR